MGLHLALGSLLLFLGTYGTCIGFLQENCTNNDLLVSNVFTVPGDVAMLHSTLYADVFSFTTVPYNISWYDAKTGREISNQTGRILVLEDTLWFLNVTLEDQGEYVTILRTPSQCYSQAINLAVNLPGAGECGRPKKVNIMFTNGVTNCLSCRLRDSIRILDSYNITSSIRWYKGCDPIVDGTDGYTYMDMAKLKIDRVKPNHTDNYTCTLTFTLGGITGSLSGTIDARVKDYFLTPQMYKPAHEIIKEHMGSSFSKECLVFVPGGGTLSVTIVWLVRGAFIGTTDRVYTSKTRQWRQDVPRKGVWLQRLLMISELKEEDFHINYTCRALTDSYSPGEYFTLLPADPNIILPIGLGFGGVMVLAISGVIFYYLFKVDIVLWFRRTCPLLYTNKDLDGKLYDAYVAYPRTCSAGFSQDVEAFALHTLPQVLEKACGYKLFIAGRDCLPGQAIVDSVEENIQASRRLFLLYTASTFTSKRHTSSSSSNNVSKNSDSSDIKTTDSRGDTSHDGSEDDCSDTRQQLECVAAMHRVLLEGTLKVVLVEMEEIPPAQLALFPESVRHLRKKQGAVCWWKTLRPRQRRRTCTGGREDKEKGGQDTRLSPSLSPSSRFWKEMRYHMPVRGKRTMYPERTALLNL
ncbi:interleukin-1 receptor type 1-like [Pempheris klunzingeri]|uniref:interleukin-1 receptor type 1-like n=1 Tax=Pempheris klunzingeri TaxID=3127111 RepID=UPI00398063E1